MGRTFQKLGLVMSRYLMHVSLVMMLRDTRSAAISGSTLATCTLVAGGSLRKSLCTTTNPLRSIAKHLNCRKYDFSFNSESSLHLSVGLCVCLSVCPVHCGKTADRIWMRFGTVGRMGPGMRQVVGFGDRSTGGFWGECGAPHCNERGVCGVAV